MDNQIKNQQGETLEAETYEDNPQSFFEEIRDGEPIFQLLV